MGKPSGGVVFPGGTKGNDIIDARAMTSAVTINGKAGNDTIYGGQGADTIYGEAGNDRIYGSPNDKLIDGGAGVDTLDFSLFVADSSGQGVNARIFGGELGLWPDQDGVPVAITGTIKNFENLIGSNYNDVLMGGNGVNQLSGGGGNDGLIAWGSGDFLTGGSGADNFVLDDAGAVTTITDFNYSAGDRLFSSSPISIQWTSGFGIDASGNSQSAWIGSYIDWLGNAEQVILLGVAETPQASWIATLG